MTRLSSRGAGAYLDGLPGVALIAGDLRDPDGILGNPELRRVIDFSRPVALSMTLLLHFVRDERRPLRERGQTVRGPVPGGATWSYPT